MNGLGGVCVVTVFSANHYNMPLTHDSIKASSADLNQFPDQGLHCLLQISVFF